MLVERSRFVLVTVIVLGLPAATTAQTPLSLGTSQQAKVSSDSPTEFIHVAKTAGLLAVAIQGEGDLALTVADEDGQTMPDGNVDRDLNGSSGTEMLSLLIPEPGTYKVRVRVQGVQASTFTIAGSWLSFPAFARASSDPDRRPRTARSIVVGKPHEDSLTSESRETAGTGLVRAQARPGWDARGRDPAVGWRSGRPRARGIPRQRFCQAGRPFRSRPAGQQRERD